MNKLITYLLTATIFFFTGYFSRLYQESEHRDKAFENGKKFVIGSIRSGIEEGYIFFIEDLKFIPRKDRAVNVKIK